MRNGQWFESKRIECRFRNEYNLKLVEEAKRLKNEVDDRVIETKADEAKAKAEVLTLRKNGSESKLKRNLKVEDLLLGREHEKSVPYLLLDFNLNGLVSIFKINLI